MKYLPLTDPVDSFMLLGLREYKEFSLQNVAASDLNLPEQTEEDEKEEQEKPPSLSEEAVDGLVELVQGYSGRAYF